ncbi:hypothetical protein [Deinococcus cellulosilyticus]|uniref:Uncharacterized protein n=1 Tax=Deinococcus cellulosilyticus (strain DSM 18568 / NBRC 106333 / KACC 11606 / 5516J-15) TaxID=1223518 RepID=A0A511MW23_DEIC1|nr:hypothetical protein [Deinococcus cellulosilyticus]GEM44601.1 hypothetical protein DC3_02360 [Deinococcus cellulosilyticus NBRC 106333 = KACC 11606]
MTALPSYWLSLPSPDWDEGTLQVFGQLYQQHVASGQGGWMPGDVPVPLWSFLRWMEQHPVVFHGSGNPDIEVFEPRTPLDFSADAFSKQHAVFASGDGIWAMFYAILNRPVRFLNGALQVRQQAGWSPMHYFFSVNGAADRTQLWREGTLYVLPKSAFQPQPPYLMQDREILEPQWICPHPVRPLAKIQVSPQVFPLLSQVRFHDQQHVDFWAAQDPEGFPWLNADGTPRSL